MTPIKQTIYLPQKENGNYSIHWNKDKIFNHAVLKEGYFFTPEELNEYTANVIKQALETAAEETAYTDDGLDYKELRLPKQTHLKKRLKSLIYDTRRDR
jgi:hypothetical protein